MLSTKYRELSTNGRNETYGWGNTGGSVGGNKAGTAIVVMRPYRMLGCVGCPRLAVLTTLVPYRPQVNMASLMVRTFCLRW